MGTRAIVTEMVNEMLKKLTDNKTGLYAFDPVVGEEKFNRALALYDAFEGTENGRITVGFGVQATDMLSTELLCRMYREARSRNKKFMLHLEQGDREIDQMQRRYGKRSIAYLEELGMLDENMLAVHLTESSGEDAKYLAGKGASLLNCAGTIGLIDGINPPIGEYLAAGDVYKRQTFSRTTDCRSDRMAERLLDVSGLKKYYPIKKNLLGKPGAYVKAVNGVDFFINKGETLGLVGESGCGKSTVGKCIIGLEAITEGSITMDGLEISAMKEQERRHIRKDIQMVFQNPYASLNQRRNILQLSLIHI